MRVTLVDLLVIGAGPAGLAAALSAAAAGVRKILLVDRLPEPGGILQQCIHNGFGLSYFGEELTGPEYAQRFIDQLSKYPQITIKTGAMVTDLTPDRTVTVISPRDGLRRYRAQAVVLAMGCRERPRGALNIPGTRPAGIYTAGSMQRLMNIEGFLPARRAVILGSGDIGLIMARRLTLEGVKVETVLELLPYSSGLTRNVVQCLEDFSIPLRLSHTVTEIQGTQRVTGIKAAPVSADLKPNLDQSFTIDCDTLVLSVGLIPENELSLMAGVKLDPLSNGPLVDSNYQTTVSGIFACGNLALVHDLVDDVSLEGRIAGQSAAQFIAGRLGSDSMLPIAPGRNVRLVVPQRIATGRETTLYIRPCRPERNAVLRVGMGRARHRIVTPGETIRYTVKPEQLNLTETNLSVSLETEGELNYD